MLICCSITVLGAGCGNKQVDGGVFRSDSIADSWTQKVFVSQQKKKVISISAEDINKLSIDPVDHRIVYAITKTNCVYKTYNSGDQWELLPLDPAGGINYLTSDPIYANNVYVARGADILKSVDGGYHFESIYRESTGATITRIVVDWYHQQRLYAATTGGAIIQSIDEGKSWKVVHQTDEPITELAMDAKDSRVVYALEYQSAVWKTDDSGAHWVNLFDTTEERLERQQELDQKDEVTYEKIDGQENPNAIAREKAEAEFIRKLEQSKPQVDFKKTFGKAEEVLQLTVDPNNPNVVYTSSERGILRSADGGENWQWLNTLIERDSDQNLEIRNMRVMPGKSNTIVFTIGRLIHKSTDGGKTWVVIDNFPSVRTIASLVFDPEEPEIVYSGVQEVKKKDDNPFLLGK